MSLNPRAIATLGVGFGAVSVAYLGLWPVTSPVEPPAEEAYRPRAAAPFVVVYEPELPEVLLRLETVEPRDTARFRLATGPIEALGGVLVTEPADGAGFWIEVEASVSLALVERADGAAAAIAVDWSDDDDEVLDLLAQLAMTT